MPDPAPKKIGLIAGWGRYPIVVAKTLRSQGFEVYCLGIKNHADPELANICADFRTFGIARLGAQIRYLRRRGIKCATMAGKIFKHLLLYQGVAWIRHLPDLRGFRAAFPFFFSRTKDLKDDTMLNAFVNEFGRDGIRFAPATDFAPELLVGEGRLTRRKVTAFEHKDILFGWNLAKEMGRLDVGQSVAVRDRVAIAVEAMEGTDQCIQRTGELCPRGGFTVVKVAKPQQDMRFDVPTIGLGTLETLVAAGGQVLAVEADKTIIIDQPQVIEYADRHRLTVIAVNEQSLQHTLSEVNSSHHAA